MSDQMNMDEERAAFEAWVESKGDADVAWLERDKRHGFYINLTVSAWWEAWQAARRAAPSAPMGEELPALPEHHGYTGPHKVFFLADMEQYACDAIAPYAERIRLLERERATPAWAAFAENGNVIIWSRRRSEVEPVAVKYDRPVEPIIAHIDGRTAGAAPDELIEIGNRMATTLEVLATALKNPGTADGVRCTVNEWRAAARSPQPGKEGGDD